MSSFFLGVQLLLQILQMTSRRSDVSATKEIVVIKLSVLFATLHEKIIDVR